MSDLVIDVKLSANGRMVLPKPIRKAMGVEGESRLILSVENGEARLKPVARGIARAQELYRKHATHDISSDEFLATRERD